MEYARKVEATHAITPCGRSRPRLIFVIVVGLELKVISLTPCQRTNADLHKLHNKSIKGYAIEI